MAVLIVSSARDRNEATVLAKSRFASLPSFLPFVACQREEPYKHLSVPID
jgi:hypothetical protein